MITPETFVFKQSPHVSLGSKEIQYNNKNTFFPFLQYIHNVIFISLDCQIIYKLNIKILFHKNKQKTKLEVS